MEDKNRIHYGWIILILGVATVAGALGLARFGYTMILPAMKSGLALTDSQAGDLAMGNMAGYLILALAAGFLSTHFSPRVVVSGFMALVSLSMLVTGLAPDFITAFAGRVFTGMGSGGANVPVIGIVMTWFAGSRRGFATGIAVSGSSFALLLTGLAIPPILNMGGPEGWRFSWYFLSAIALIIAILCGIFLRNTPADMNVSPIGSSGIPESSEKAHLSSIIKSWRLIYRSFDVWHLAIIYTLFGFSYIIYATFFVRYLNWEAGFTLENAGRLWSLVGVISIASGFIWGTFSDKAGRKYALASVFILQSVCYLIFGVWKGMPGYYTSALLFSITAWSIPAIMAAAAGDILGAKLAPAALGFLTLFFGIGQMFGPFTAGRIADAYGSYTYAFVIAASASFAGGLLSLLLRIKKPARI
jgi:predicted MFS family arabinose efflux permease